MPALRSNLLERRVDASPYGLFNSPRSRSVLHRVKWTRVWRAVGRKSLQTIASDMEPIRNLFHIQNVVSHQRATVI